MQAPAHVVVKTTRPAEFTLRQMGATAKASADTQTVREWAARLATKAPARDYREMLRMVYDDIIARWRYVPESDEWIHGTPESLLSTVLGLKYTAPGQDPTRLNLGAVPTGEKGWGDCDDVATVVAAAVRALGMRPLFRVARGESGAHVSVVARTPDGEMISVDPVGHPRHEFGWALDVPDVRLFDLDGQPTAAFGGPERTMTQPRGTFYSDPTGRPRMVAHNGHWCATHAGDGRGPRALALPMREAQMFARGHVVDDCPAVDDNGNGYTYDANRDLWIDDRLNATRVGERDESLGGIGRRRRRRARGGGGGRRGRRRARRQKRRARRRRIIKRVAKRVRPLVAKAMGSRIGRAAVSSALTAVGVPPRLTRGVMAAGAKILKAGGIPALVRLLKTDKKAAARLVAQAAKAGAMSARSVFGADFQRGVPVAYQLSQHGSRPFFGQPVMALAGVPGLTFGAIEVTPTPTPGQFYRIQKGDNLSRVRKAAGVDARWINSAASNQPFHRPSRPGFESNYYGPTIMLDAFLPRWADNPDGASKGESGSRYAVIWIPAAPGDEPPVIVEPIEPIEPIEPDPIEPEDEVVPDTPDLPPDDEVVEPDVPTEDELREECVQSEHGYWVEGQGCIVCPEGQYYDYAKGDCVSEDVVIPDVVIPDVVVPDDDPGGDPCPPYQHLDCPGGGQPCRCVPDTPDVVIPDVVIPDDIDPEIIPLDPGADPSKGGKLPIPLLLAAASMLLR